MRRKAPQHVVDIGKGLRVVALVAGGALPVHQLIKADPDPLEPALMPTADEAKIGGYLPGDILCRIAIPVAAGSQPCPVATGREVVRRSVVIRPGVGDGQGGARS